MKKIKTLKKNYEFKNVLSKGKFFVGKYVTIYIKNNKLIIENDCTPISNEHLEHIFEAFYRVEFDRNKSSGGNGLGLYIVQQILTTTKLTYSFKPIKNGMKFEIDFNNKNII